MTSSKASQPVFDDRDRARAHDRLGAVDDLGAARLRDPLWPGDDDRRRQTDAIQGLARR